MLRNSQIREPDPFQPCQFGNLRVWAPRPIFMLAIRKWILVPICGILLSSILSAQYGPQLPIPSIHRRKSTPPPEQARHVEINGAVRSIDAKTLIVGSNDGRTFTIALTEKTNYMRGGKSISLSSILPRANVDVEATPDDQDNLTAVAVTLLKDPPRADESQQQESTSTETPARPNIMKSSVDAPDRPILHRGGPSPRRATSSSDEAVGNDSEGQGAKGGKEQDDSIIVEPDPASSSSAKPKPSSSDDLISRTRDWVGSFSGSLPNFVCQQLTTRYVEESKQTGWQAIDVVSAEVVYEDGRESYRNITVGGKKTSKSMLELGGSTSTGEFATTLRSLFSPGSRADFKFYRTASLRQAPGAIYDFKVALHNSDWQIRVGGQTLVPAYSGTVWIDKASSQVRRIEMQADNIPSDFPLDAIEWAVDYDMVSLGSNQFFLPIHAENLGCQRGSSVCMKNAIDFRNYHKFSGESTIQFGK